MNTRIKINSALVLSLVFLLNACSKAPEAEETTKEVSKLANKIGVAIVRFFS